jgi:hypothetical protein
MAGVELQFLPPDEDDMVTLHVEEAPASTGTFAEIQTFPAGTYPDYIREADVTNATSSTHWFRIRWQDDVGNYTPYSAPIQGGTTTIVAQVMDRVLLRDPSIDPLVAGQEAEAVICMYFGVEDPYSVDPSLATPRILSGLTMLTMARCYIIKLISSGTTTKWQAGLVSMDQSSTTKQAWEAIERMFAYANRELDMNYSAILQLKEIETGGGLKQLKVYDVSRLMIELA